MDLDIFYCLHCLVMLNIVLILYGRILIKAGHFCCLFKSWQYFSLSDREIFFQCNQCMKTDLTSSADTFWVKSKLPITVLLSCSKPRRSNNNKYAFQQDAYRPLVDRIAGGGGRGSAQFRGGGYAWGGLPNPGGEVCIGGGGW